MAFKPEGQKRGLESGDEFMVQLTAAVHVHEIIQSDSAPTNRAGWVQGHERS